MVEDEKLCRKRKRILTNDSQSKSLKIEAELSHEGELLIQDDLIEEEIGLDEKEDVIKKHEEEKSISVKAVNILDDEEQNIVEKEGQRVLSKSVCGKEDMQKVDDDDEMLAYLWPGSGRRSVV